ncbi:hypothetical protein GCM10022393_41770 [Aquimarina addita]|uniref:Uncharacterized protein n=1 Tax=Aquimarina addita TaxID=870485 RepID=A0ABP6UXY2_9FLAO
MIDKEKTLTTGYLSKCGYFKANHKLMGSTGWTSSRSKDLGIDITVIMQENNERVILNYYDFNLNSVKQIIYLESKPSNLDKGLVWFFVCPYASKCCRNLIFVCNRFMHRSNLINPMYSTQAESKYWRKLFQLQPNIPTTQKVLDEPKKKYYKKYYKGEMTKRYKKHISTLVKWRNNREERSQLLMKQY